MRRRSWALIVLLVLILVLALPARGDRALETLLGALVLAALVVALLWIPWRPKGWRPMPGLFARPRPPQEWCTGCGTPQRPPCPTCGPRRRERQAPNSQKPVRKRA